MGNVIKRVDARMALDALVAAVDREGGDTRRGCRYVINGRPFCIDGCAFFELGIDIDALKKMDEKNSSVSTLWHAGNGRIAHLQFTYAAMMVLQRAQMEQDSGYEWQTALNRARSTYDELKEE